MKEIVFDIIKTYFKSEISNSFEINLNEMVIILEDGTCAKITIE